MKVCEGEVGSGTCARLAKHLFLGLYTHVYCADINIPCLHGHCSDSLP